MPRGDRTSGRHRFPHSVYGEGTEPDPRFSLANERTFLAGLRTALALTAAGVALEALAIPLQPQLRLAASLILVLLGILTPALAWRGWARDERAMRRGDPLPEPGLISTLSVGTSTAGLLVLLGLLLG